VEPVINLLCKELGYEDRGEFEDALQGDFEDFLEVMPHLETRKPYEGEEGGLRFRYKAMPPEEERVPIKMVYRITESADLWRVCLKNPRATMCIPELEFEMSADGKRHVDAVYNHIAAAIFNLGNHVREELKECHDVPEDYRYRLMETCTALNWLLDVEQPFTIIVTDPDGTSCFKPDGVEDGKVVYIMNPAEDDPVGNERLACFCAVSNPAAAQPWLKDAGA